MQKNYKDSGLSIGAVFKEAWHQVKGMKGPVFMAEIYVFFITTLFLFVFSLVGLLITSVIPVAVWFLHCISALITGGLLICGMAYINRFCIKKLSGCNPDLTLKSFFRPYGYLSQAVVLYVLNIFCLFIFVGIIFLSLVLMGFVFEGTAAIAMGFSPGSPSVLDMHHGFGREFILIILSIEIIVAFCFYSFFMTVFQLTIPVAMNQKIRVFLALKLLFISFGHQFFKIIWINFLSFLIILVSILPLGVGLIWSLPLAYNLNASIYKRTLGLSIQKRVDD